MKNNEKNHKKEGVSENMPSLDNYSAMDDFLFLKYLGEKGNSLQQRSFLKTLGINIEGKITTTNTKMPPDKKGGKKSRLDSRIITECEKDINIEVQRKKTDDFIERLTTYAYKRAIEPIAKGQNYKKMKKIISLAICGYSFLESPKYHNIFHLKNSNIYINEKLIDNLEIHIIEMEKFRTPIIYEDDPNDKANIIETEKDLKNNLKHQYLAFIDDKTTHKERKEIVKMGDEGLKASMKNLELAFQNGAFDEYFREKLDEMHQENIMQEKLEKGIKIGKIEGKEEEKIEIAIRLKKLDLPIEQIVESTGLTPNFIEKL